MYLILRTCFWLFYPFRFFFRSRRSTVYGKAQFMGYFERSAFLSRKNRGLVFSAKHRLSLDESFKNLCLIAPTGSGKTTRYVIPNILRCSGSVVVTDPSGEIYRITSKRMKKRGYRIQVLEPANLSDTLRFNPLHSFQTSQDLKRVATILGSQNSGHDLFWSTGAINIIYICLRALQGTSDASEMNIGRVRELLNQFGVNGEGIDGFMKKHLDDAAFDEYKAFLAQDDKVIASVLSSARIALDLWSDPDIARFSRENSVDIPSLRREKSIVYVIVPEHQVRYFSIIINLFYSACFEHCLRHPDGHPVFYFLDEFGNLGRIPDFATIATTLRKRRCSLNIILQELSQLRAVYGREEAQSIYSGGMANKLFFSGLDLETCQYVERMLGSNTEYDTVTVTGDVKLDDRARTVSTPLMRADEIRMLPRDDAILISGSRKPIRLQMLPFYKCTS